MQANLSREEFERLAAFAFGFIIGLVLIALAASLFEEWVIQGDLADRRRIRELVKEELARQRVWPKLDLENKNRGDQPLQVDQELDGGDHPHQVDQEQQPAARA